MCFPACHLCQISQKKLLRKPLNLKGLGRGGPNLLTLRLSPRRLEQLCRERSELCLLQTEGDSSLLKPSDHLKAYIGVGRWSERVLCPGLRLDCEGEGRRSRWDRALSRLRQLWHQAWLPAGASTPLFLYSFDLFTFLVATCQVI